MVHELGVFDVYPGTIIPGESSWAVVTSPVYVSPDLLQNPGFELGIQGWGLLTPSGITPMSVNILPGHVGNSAVMVSDELGYRGGLNQDFTVVPPGTTFRYKAVIKTVDVEALEAFVLYYDIMDAEGNWYGGDAGKITGSNDWGLYEVINTSR